MFEGLVAVSEKSDFSLGAIVLPATDGLLAELGYDVKSLGPLALGIVIEEGSRRSHVHFPEIKCSLWLDHNEIKDVVDEMKVNESFRIIERYLHEGSQKMLLPVLLSNIVKFFQSSHVLGVDHGPMEEVWEETPAKLKEYFDGDLKQETCRISLGVEELNPKTLDELKKALDSRLLLTRFLPSGMYKFEVSFYVRRL